MDDETVLTPREAARLLRISLRHLTYLVRDDRVPHARIGRNLRFDREQLLVWLRRGGTQAIHRN
jgi:excisionase family DNA binding protein